MRRAALAVLLAAFVANAALAAELPSRAQRPAPSEPKPRACEIDGAPGFRLPDGGCVRVSGYVSTGVSVKSLKP